MITTKNPDDAALHGFTRRRFIRTALLGSALASLPFKGFGLEPSRQLRALVIERKGALGIWQPSTGLRSELLGAARALTKAGFEVVNLDLTKPLEEQPADLLVLGSYVSCHDDVVGYLEANQSALRNFCEQGGVVLQMVEAPPFKEAFYASNRPIRETSALFLPPHLSANRTRETFWDNYVREPGHPLLAGLDVEEKDGRRQWNLSEKFNDNASWMAIGEREGFKVLVGNTEDDGRAALLESYFGAGRYFLCSFLLDKLVEEDGTPGQSDEFIAEAERFFANLHDYTQQVRSGGASRVAAASYADPKPAEFVDGSFTLVLIPDTQYYCQYTSSHRHFHNLVEWIVRERDALNIKYVLHVGDVVNQGGLEMSQWDVATAAMYKLDGQVPYAIAIGNHDYTDDRSISRDTPLNDFFPPSRYGSWSTFGGVMEEGHLENAWHTFRAHDTDFLILCLEFGPRDHVLEWANTIVDRHPNHRVILNTHAHTYADNHRYNKRERGKWQRGNPLDYRPEGGANDGQQVWEKLVDRHPNFLLVNSGHVTMDGLGRTSSRTQHGNLVHQMLFNYQSFFEGGAGAIRLLHFLPDRKTVQVRTIHTTEGNYATGPQEQFTLELEPLLAPA
jgi:hypothetical protein